MFVTVASLGLVSPGAVTDGVTLYFSSKTDDLFVVIVLSKGNDLFLVIAAFQVIVSLFRKIQTFIRMLPPG